jgi:hypothetical protein
MQAGPSRVSLLPPSRSGRRFRFAFTRSVKRDFIVHLATSTPPPKPTASSSWDLLEPANPPGHRSGHQSLPGRPQGRFRHRGGVGRPAQRRPQPRQAQEELTSLGRIPCWSQIRSATSPSKPKPQTCSSSGSRRYERASVIVTSNAPLRPLGEKYSATTPSPPP